MSQSEVPNDWEWRYLHERLDRAIAEAARGYMLRLAAQHIKINVGKLSDELDELRFGREPDYDLPGFPHSLRTQIHAQTSCADLRIAASRIR